MVACRPQDHKWDMYPNLQALGLSKPSKPVYRIQLPLFVYLGGPSLIDESLTEDARPVDLPLR